MRLDLLLIFLATFVFIFAPVSVLIEVPNSRKPIIIGCITAAIAAGIWYLFYISV